MKAFISQADMKPPLSLSMNSATLLYVPTLSRGVSQSISSKSRKPSPSASIESKSRRNSSVLLWGNSYDKQLI